MTEEEKKDFTELISNCIHDIRGSITVLQLLLSSWEASLTDEQQEDYPTLMKEIEKIKLILNQSSEEFKSRLNANK
ncbi:hypothetical protein ACFL57_01180 [Candidatus Margulisiibacteriota bacterium]